MTKKSKVIVFDRKPRVLSKVLDIHGESVKIFYTPMSTGAMAAVMEEERVETESDGEISKANQVMRNLAVIADHLTNEEGEPLYESAEDANEFPVVMLKPVTRMLLGQPDEVPLER